MNEYEQLRALLLGDELASIKHIQEELIRLQQSIDNPEELIRQIAPHFSGMLKHASSVESAQFEASIVHAIEQLIEHGSKESYDTIIQKLSPTLYKELHHYTATHKEQVSDLLYPVVGGMISKYVAQMLQDMMNDINAKIQHGLSIQNMKRKIRAKVQGIDESELLLYESMPLHVKAALLIHKPMGAVMVHRVDEGDNIDEPEMVGSMLTALTDFINNWIHKQEEFSEVSEINYGGSKIYLEATGSSYLAVLIDGQSTQELTRTTNKVLGGILDCCSTQIQDFNGDFSQLPRDRIYELMAPLFMLNQHHATSAQQPPSKWPLIIIAGLLVVTMGWLYFNAYKKEAFKEMMMQRIETNPHLTLYAIDAQWNDNTLVFHGKLPNAKLNEEMSGILMSKKFPYEIENRVIVIEPLKDYGKSKRLIEKQIALLNQDRGTRLFSKVNNGIVYISGETANTQKLHDAVSIIKELDAITHVYTEVTSIDAEEPAIYFKSGSYVLAKEYYPIIEEIATMLQKFPSSHLTLIGYSSPSKDIAQNLLLAEHRAQSVADALISLGIGADRITCKGMSQAPLFSDNNNSKSQCVKFYWYNIARQR